MHSSAILASWNLRLSSSLECHWFVGCTHCCSSARSRCPRTTPGKLQEVAGVAEAKGGTAATAAGKGAAAVAAAEEAAEEVAQEMGAVKGEVGEALVQNQQYPR